MSFFKKLFGIKNKQNKAVDLETVLKSDNKSEKIEDENLRLFFS